MKRREVIRMFAAAATARFLQVNALSMPLPLMPLFPLNVVLLPGNNLPLHIFEPRYREMIQECIDRSGEFGVLRMTGAGISQVGCTARVSDVIHRYRDGTFDILTRGERRFRIMSGGQDAGKPGSASLSERDFNSERPFFRGVPDFFEDVAPTRAIAESDELIGQALELRVKLMSLIAADDPQSGLPTQKPPAASHPQLSFQLMDGLPADVDWKQELLELRVERERLVRVVLHLQRLIEYMQSDPENPTPRRVA